MTLSWLDAVTKSKPGTRLSENMHHHRKMQLPKHIYIIGAGGVTTYFLPAFIKTVANKFGKEKPFIHLIDGDKVESRNLERQLFERSDVGENKADALVQTFKEEYKNLMATPRFFSNGDRIIEESLVFGFVDNHPAKRALLAACDASNSNAILAANEYTDSQAIWYEPSAMRGNRFDPRVRYPEILDDESDNPLRPIGCNAPEALAAAPQLAIANLACASHALQLFWFHYVIKPTLDQIESRPYWPVEHSNNFNRLTTKVEESYVG